MVRFVPRSAGVLLHVTNLPGPHGIGDFGPAARAFADWLAAAGFRWWQVLPLNPTDPYYGSSPYRSPSSAALSPGFLSPDLLVTDGLLEPTKPRRAFPSSRVDYPATRHWKDHLLDLACARIVPAPGFRRFRAREADWLDDFALFTALKGRFGQRPWTDWPPPLRDRDPAALADARRTLGPELRRTALGQYLLDRQWQSLRAHCRRLGIGIIGDLPIYADPDSADVWAHREFFLLDRLGRPRFAAGVPPDAFSATGQLWGNPVYDWPALTRDGFRWWLDRAGRALRLFDVVRLDHFRGLVAYWQVPAGAPTAERGRWVRAPASRLLAALRGRFPDLPFIAEDLGFITPDVERARRHAGLPGMKVAVFGFGTDDSIHRPDRAGPGSVLYSSTHDTDTLRGWLETEARPDELHRLRSWLGDNTTGRLLRACFEAPAPLVIVPAQDLLGLGSRARMNRPGTTGRNWRWRLRPGQLTARLAARLRRRLAAANRLTVSPGP
ncbi:MAG: 4-alpha-glucanotransferase [bacterium]